MQHLANRGSRPVGHHHDLVGQQHGLVHIVRDHDHGAVGASHDLQQLVLQLGTRQGVESAEGLVHEQHLGLHGQGAGNAHALLHAARDFAGALLRRMAEAHHGQRRIGALRQLCLAFALAEDTLHGQVHIAPAAQPGQQRMILEDHRTLGAGALDFLVGAQQCTARGNGQAGNQIEQRRLAAARMPDETDELALGNVQVDVAQCGKQTLGGLEGLLHPVDLDVLGAERCMHEVLLAFFRGHRGAGFAGPPVVPPLRG